jgi:hypothetical protein
MPRQLNKNNLVLFAGTTLLIVAMVSVFLWIGYTKLKGYSSNPLTYGSCISEVQSRVKNVSGWDFEVEYSNCDTIAKDEAIWVFAIRAEDDNSRWRRPLARRRLVFHYDPGRWDNPPPTIKATGNNRVLITVPEVSSIDEKNTMVGDTDVDYEIGRIDYQ